MKEFFGNIKLEFKKITWPTDKEMRLHTTQVFVFMVILSLFFAATDAVISAGVYAATRDNDAIVEEIDYPTEDNYVTEENDDADYGTEDNDETEEDGAD